MRTLNRKVRKDFTQRAQRFFLCVLCGIFAPFAVKFFYKSIKTMNNIIVLNQDFYKIYKIIKMKKNLANPANLTKILVQIIFVLCAANVPLFSQEIKEIKGVEGRCAIANISPEQAREKAIEEAKKEALRKAGVAERIRSTDALSTYETNAKSNQMFSSFSSIEMEGAVTDYKVVKDRREENSIDGKWYAVVVIDATVKKYQTVPDPEFKIEVSGLRSNGYKKGDEITFSVTPNKEGYLKIFVFENADDAMQLFPNKHDSNRKFKEKETVKFPENYNLNATKSTEEKQEHNWFVFVYTKKDIPFKGATTRQNILGWLNNIEPEQKEVVVETIMISD